MQIQPDTVRNTKVCGGIVSCGPAICLSRDGLGAHCVVRGRRRSSHLGHSLGTHAVQTGGGFVGAFVEFGSGPDGGHDHLECGLARLGMHIHRDAAAIVEDEDGVVDIDLNDDDLAVASEVFVNGVVDQFVDQVV